MDKNIVDGVNLLDLSLEELKSLNGGAPAKSSSFIYDAVYSLSYIISRSEIFTSNFWVEWGYAVL